VAVGRAHDGENHRVFLRAATKTVLILILLATVAGNPWYVAAQEEEPGRTLFERTLMADLETAERQELLEWAGSLGLSTRGSRAQVEQRILDFYNATRPTPDPDAPSQDERDGAVMRIQRARGSRFFDLEQVGERNLRLVGGVLLTVEEEGAVHTIEAEEILINVDRSTLGARGDVRYRVERSDGEEEFRGESIVFDITSWAGVFIRGITETQEQIDEETVDFRVEGERITRSREEIIVLDRATVTSSEADPPNWRIRASRIWILAPGEWSLRHAVLYVGRVPAFYLPFFFLPGDRLFFHPVAGNRTREGSFIQTTTYVFGSREDDDPPISILRLAETPDESERVIEGLFLRIPDEPVESARPDWSLKLMADVYTTLGMYGGVAASMPDLGPVTNLDWRLGLGASRNIYFENQQYSSYYVDEGLARQHWNSDYFLGRPVPYRFESELSSVARIGSLSLTLEVLLLSDPEFRRDFHNRSERMDWAFLLSPGEEEEPPDASVTSLTWDARLNWSPAVRSLNPWVTSFSVSPARVQALWRTRTDEERPDPVRLPTSDNSPEEKFFYPQSMVVPEIQMRVQGTLYQYPRPSSGTGSDSGDDRSDHDETNGKTDGDDKTSRLRPPWEEERSPIEEEKDDRFRMAPRIDNLRGIRDPDAGDFRITYTVQPLLRYDRFTDNNEWRTGRDVALEWQYSTFQTRNRGQVAMTGRARERLATASSTLSFDQRYQSLDVAADIPETQREQLELDTFRFRGYTLNQSSEMSLFPLRRVDPLEDSSVQYSLATLVYENRFIEMSESGDPRYESRWGRWDEEDVTGHRTRAQIRWNLWSATQSLTATSDLPPRERTYLGELRLVTGPLTTTLTGGYREIEDEWKPDNFVQDHVIAFYEGKARLEQSLEYDVEEEQLLQSRSALRLWPLSMRLVGRRTRGYDFDPAGGWVLDDDEQFRWTSLVVGLAGERSIRTWHRRVDFTLQGELAVDVDLLRYGATGLVVDYGFELSVHRFLDLQLTARSRNDFLYQYIPSLADEIGRSRRRFLEDLTNSLNVFDSEAREESLFKLDSLTIMAVHDLQDWELSVSYTGRPELERESLTPRYEWRGVLAIMLQWRPISEFRRNIQIETDGEIEFIE
jgi:hypothetical protein